MHHHIDICMNTIRLLSVILCVLVVFTEAAAQIPQRLPVLTGFTSGLVLRGTSSGTWIVDGATIYRGGPAAWNKFPELYRCGPARIAFATDTLITVVANRFMTSDTAWWVFTGDRRTMRWTDSVRLEARGQFLCGLAPYLLFSLSEPDAEMSVDVYDADGNFRRTMQMPRVRNTSWVVARSCGDSVVIADATRSVPVYDVIRNGGAAPTQWTAADLPDVRFGFVGEGNAFVFQTDAGTFVDYGGEVRPLASMTDRLQDLFMNGRAGARIAQGGIEYARDITVGQPSFAKAGPNLYPGLDRIMAYDTRLAHVWRTGGNLNWFRRYADANGQTQTALVAAIDGAVSRGSRYLLSGDEVAVADHSAVMLGLYANAISAFRSPVSGDTLALGAQRTGDFRTVMLARVGDEVWHGTTTGVQLFPTGTPISNRNGYLVAAEKGANGPVYMLTDRGVEVRDQASAPWRVLLPDYVPTAMAVSGDSLLLLRVEDIGTETPESRIVLDAYDGQGNPYFAGVVVIDSAVSKGIVFRSMSRTPSGLLINGTTRLFRSVDAGASWTSIDPGMRLTTPLATYNGTTAAWGEKADGTRGPCLMITPDRWVMQPVELRTAAPAEAVAMMSGWFVFSTSDGLWSVRQTISSYTYDAEPTEVHRGGPADETHMFDIMGRKIDEGYAPSGAYFLRQRYGSQWVTRPILNLR